MTPLHRLAPVLVPALLSAVPAVSGTLHNLADSFDAADARALRLESAVGAVRITGGAGSRVQAEVELSCSILGGDRCREVAGGLKLVAERRGEILELRLGGLPDGDGVRGLTAAWHLQVPAALGLDLQLGVGDLRITSMLGDVDASVGVGRVEILASAGAVKAVDLTSGVGDVDLLVRNRSVEEGGSGFVDDRLEWAAGAGSARLHVDCGVGSVRVSLD